MRRAWKSCAVVVAAVVSIGACKAVEELQEHLSGVQFEMRAEKLDVAGGAFVVRAAPPTKRQPLVIAHDGAIYALGGIDGSLRPVAAVEKYDPASNAWTTRAPWPSPRVTSEFLELGQLCTLGGLLSSAGGGLSCYDPTKDTWSERAAIPSNAGTGTFREVVAGGKLYAFATAGKDPGDAGAFDATTFDEAGTDVGPEPGALSPTAWFAYDPVTDAWAEKTAAPFACVEKQSDLGPGNNAIVSIGTTVYVLGCTQELASHARVDIALAYDTVADAWSEIPPGPGLADAAFVFGGKIVAVIRAAPFISTYDPTARSWTASKASPPPLLAPSSLAVVADASGILYFDMADYVGSTSNQVYNGEAWRYDLATDAWKKVATLARDVDASYHPAFVPVMLGPDPYLVGSWLSEVLSIH